MVKIDKKWMAKYLAWIILVVSWIVIFGIKVANPEISLKTPIIVTAIISVIIIASVVLKNVNLGGDEKQIAKLTQDEIKKLIKKEIHDNRWNNLNLTKPWEWVKTKTINNDLIYSVMVNCNLDDEQVLIFINASEPMIAPTVIDSKDANLKEITMYSSIVEREMNNKARSPQGEPNITRVFTRKDEFGRPEEQREEISYSEKKEEKEEDGL